MAAGRRIGVDCLPNSKFWIHSLLPTSLALSTTGGGGAVAPRTGGLK
ncbi:MAG: hypothetical protein ACK55I_40620 [bacterium]